MEGFKFDTESSVPESSQTSLSTEKSAETLPQNSERRPSIFDRVSDLVLDKLDPVLSATVHQGKHDLINRDINDHSEKVKQSEDLSDETGIYFKNLIPRGIRKPEIDSNPEHKVFNVFLAREDIGFTSGVNAEAGKMTRSEYLRNRDRFLKNSIFFRERKEGNSGVDEQVLDNGLRQETTRSVMQNGGKNLIHEHIYNIINKDNIGYADSDLVIQSVADGQVLDLNALLPKNYRFTPIFHSIKDEKDESNPDPDIKNYDMKKVTKGGFANPNERQIGYPDLSKDGNMLVLFHEIAHAWQHQYYDKRETGRNGFKKKYEKILDFVSGGGLDFGVESNPDILKKMSEVGIDSFRVSNGDDLQEGEFLMPNDDQSLLELCINVLKDLDSGQDITLIMTREEIEKRIEELKQTAKNYAVRSSGLNDVLNTYVSEERDAWAHALRTMRFLRRKGFDVEPNLKTLKDFQDQIHWKLKTYQDSIDGKVQLQGGSYRFSRLEPETSTGNP